MDELLLLSDAQMRRIEPYFPLSHGVPRVDDRRVLSGILFITASSAGADWVYSIASWQNLRREAAARIS